MNQDMLPVCAYWDCRNSVAIIENILIGNKYIMYPK